jgi:hypothetical protein
VSARSGSASRHGATSTQCFNVKWETPALELYEKVDPQDFYSSLPVTWRSERQPLLILLTSASPDVARQTKNANENVLRDEEVALGSRLFRAIRLDGDHVSRGHPQWKTLAGNALPRLVVVDADGRRAGMLEGNDVTASNLFKLMRRAAEKTYKLDLQRTVKELHGVLDDLDRIDERLARITKEKAETGGAQRKALVEEEAKLADELIAARAREEALIQKFKRDRKVAKS